MVDPHNSGSDANILVKFSRMKGAKKYMKIIIMVFQQNFFVQGKGDKKMAHHNSGFTLRIVFQNQIFQN